MKLGLKILESNLQAAVPHRVGQSHHLILSVVFTWEFMFNMVIIIYLRRQTVTNKPDHVSENHLHKTRYFEN